MIGGGAFLLLKTGSNGWESSEQPEIPLAGFVIILAFDPGRASRRCRETAKGLENAFSG
jgi:hypothetical protein